MGQQYGFQKIWKKLLLHVTVKLGDKERFDKELIGVKEPFPVTNMLFTQVFAFSPLITTLFQHGFKGIKPSKMVGLEVFKDPND